MTVHKRECEEMKHCVDEATHYADERLYKVVDEHEKRYEELKRNGRDMIKAFAKYI